jgi:hypothetical protein
MKDSISLGASIAMIVVGLCLITYGLLGQPNIRIEFVFGGATIVTLAGWLLVDRLI